MIGSGVRILFVGVNPSLSAVATQAPFGRRGNRFYPAMYRAGILDRNIDASRGMRQVDREYLLWRGIGITSLVRRATGQANELRPEELIQGRQALARLVCTVDPSVVAVLGITAFRIAFEDRSAELGRQPHDVCQTPLWVLPNPSGRNLRATLDDIAEAFREVAVAAGMDVLPAFPR
ncbi:mismatch-specific DNA-glycosylase [Pseudonocardia xishanensis]|uniref:mismatch-specific DNA-glycosylase n=1 Tax=Pseudonocardia xishanensis TaxID=630995 RepID=UPI0031EBD9FC